MKPRESEFLHGRRLNATGCAETHPEQTLGLWASAQFCHRVTHASDASPPPRTGTADPTPKDTELTENTKVWKTWFSFLFIEHNFRKALCDQN